MPDEAIALTLSKADAEVLLGVLSAERYNAEVEAVATQRASRSTGSWPSWADQDPDKVPRPRMSPRWSDFASSPAMQIGPCRVIP